MTARDRVASTVERREVKPREMSSEAKFLDAKRWRRHLQGQPILRPAQNISSLDREVAQLQHYIDSSDRPKAMTYTVSLEESPRIRRVKSSTHALLYLPPDLATVELILEENEALSRIIGTTAVDRTTVVNDPQYWAFSSVTHEIIDTAAPFLERADTAPVFTLHELTVT